MYLYKYSEFKKIAVDIRNCMELQLDINKQYKNGYVNAMNEFLYILDNYSLYVALNDIQSQLQWYEVAKKNKEYTSYMLGKEIAYRDLISIAHSSLYTIKKWR